MARNPLLGPGPVATQPAPAAINPLAAPSVPERHPYPGEMDYFRKNPHVAGMATEDESVIINPFKQMNPQERAAVVMNETARVMMRAGKVPRPEFAVTDEQRRQFSGYGSEQDIRETIAARILSGDPSAGSATPEQSEFAKSLRGLLGRAP